MSEKTPTTRRDPIPPGIVRLELECVGIGVPLVSRSQDAIEDALRTHGLKCRRMDWGDCDATVPTLTPTQRAQAYAEIFPAVAERTEGGKL